MGESQVIQEDVFVSDDKRYLSWTDSEGVTRFYEIVSNMADDTEYAVDKIKTAIGDIGYTVVDQARKSE
jgi:hypothetical protein